jgi:hypothetical protein
LTTKEISDKARENLLSNTELLRRRRMKENTLLILRDGEGVVRIFNPEQIEPLEIDYESNDERTQRFDYTVTDPNTGRTEAFRASTRTSGDIDALLAEEYHLLKVRGDDSGKTRDTTSIRLRNHTYYCHHFFLFDVTVLK